MVDLRIIDQAECVALAGTQRAKDMAGIDGNIAIAAGTEAPWHGFANEVEAAAGYRAWLTASGTDWTVSKQRIRVVDGKVIPGRFAIVRDDNGAPLSTCGTGWTPFQNEQVAEFFQKYCDAGQLTMETFGSLHDGRYIWGLARVGDAFAVGREDVVKGFVLFMNTHEAGKAAVIKHVAMRTVCQNSLARGLREDGAEIRITHNLKFNDAMKRKAEATLKLSQDSLKNFAETAERLANTACTPEQADVFFKHVFKIGDGPDVLAAAIEATPAVSRAVSIDEVIGATETPEETQRRTSPVLVKLRESLLTGPGADLDGSRGTLWGALNAVTHVIDHKLGGDRDLRLRNAWFGYRADSKERAVEIANQVATGNISLAA
jgi:phage/plasmid-like protein (TIGR03299 family)